MLKTYEISILHEFYFFALFNKEETIRDKRKKRKEIK